MSGAVARISGCSIEFVMTMAGFDGDEHIEVARTIRAAVEEEGGFLRPYGEFRKRLAASGANVSSTSCSRLWKAAAAEKVTEDSQDEEPGDEDVPVEPKQAQETEPAQARDQEEEDQGLTLDEIGRPHRGR